MHKTLANLFLRIYAMNLRRGWREDPGTAWSDAIFTMDALIGLPVLSFIFCFWVLGLALFPGAIGVFGMPRGVEIAVVIAVGFVVDRWLSRSMGKYKRESISRDSFSSAGDFVVIVASFAGSFAFFVAMLIVSILIRRRV